MIAVNWPAWSVADTLSSAYTAASPAPYVLLTPTARAAAVDEVWPVERLDVVVADMALPGRLVAGWQRGPVSRRRRRVSPGAGGHAGSGVQPPGQQRES